MGTPSLPYSISLPPGVALLAPDVRAKPDPSQAVPRLALEYTLGLPGYGGGGFGGNYDNPYSQLMAYRGAVAVGIRPYVHASRAAKYTVLRREVASKLRKSGSYHKAIGHAARSEEYEPAEPDHPLCRILANPHGKPGGWSLAREVGYLALQYMLHGDAPAWTPFNEDGKPVQFYSLVSAATTLAMPAGSSPQYPKGAYRVNPLAAGGNFAMAGGLYAGALLPAEEVHRLVNDDPGGRGFGRSWLRIADKWIDILDSITRSRWSFFTDGPMLDAIITVPGAAQEVTDILQRQITQRHGGADNHGRRLLIVGGGGVMDKMNVQTVGMNAEEMAYLQSNEQALEMVLAALGVPKVVAMMGENGTYSNNYASIQLFHDLSLNPFFLDVSNFLTIALAEPWSEEPGELKIEAEPPPVNDVQLEEDKFQKDCDRGLVTWNQALRKRGLPSIGPEGDVPAPLYLQQLQVKLQPQQPAAIGGGDPTQQPGEDAQPDPLAALMGGAATPTGGAPPRPANPASKGSLPPKPEAKSLACDDAMSTADDAHGGFLVAPTNRLARRKKKSARAIAARVLKSLEQE